jgi:hypothetical protein
MPSEVGTDGPGHGGAFGVVEVTARRQRSARRTADTTRTGPGGPPPEEATTLIVVGFPEERVRQWFGRVELAGRIDNGLGLDNDEQGAPVWLVRDRLARWAELWPQLRRLG